MVLEQNGMESRAIEFSALGAARVGQVSDKRNKGTKGFACLPRTITPALSPEIDCKHNTLLPSYSLQHLARLSATLGKRLGRI